ncbi:MAG: zinc transporter ZupT, partial [Candidatus Lokiarchaeota archaeon]|nr:zinc transporter ZupT [Candidatus Lokiarchaeota archaeon]
MTDILIPLLLTAVAGLSTGIGSAIAYFIKRPKTVYLSFALGLSAGVMVYVSFVELLPAGFESMGDPLGVLVFFIGMAIVGIIDALLPEYENPHHPT